MNRAAAHLQRPLGHLPDLTFSLYKSHTDRVTYKREKDRAAFLADDHPEQVRILITANG